MRDIGAIEFGWWHSWHFTCKMGATSFENVVCFADVSAARTGAATTRAAPIVNMPADSPLHLRNPQTIMDPLPFGVYSKSARGSSTLFCFLDPPGASSGQKPCRFSADAHIMVASWWPTKEAPALLPAAAWAQSFPPGTEARRVRGSAQGVGY